MTNFLIILGSAILFFACGLLAGAGIWRNNAIRFEELRRKVQKPKATGSGSGQAGGGKQ